MKYFKRSTDRGALLEETDNGRQEMPPPFYAQKKPEYFCAVSAFPYDAYQLIEKDEGPDPNPTQRNIIIKYYKNKVKTFVESLANADLPAHVNWIKNSIDIAVAPTLYNEHDGQYEDYAPFGIHKSICMACISALAGHAENMLSKEKFQNAKSNNNTNVVLQSLQTQNLPAGQNNIDIDQCKAVIDAAFTLFEHNAEYLNNISRHQNIPHCFTFYYHHILATYADTFAKVKEDLSLPYAVAEHFNTKLKSACKYCNNQGIQDIREKQGKFLHVCKDEIKKMAKYLFDDTRNNNANRNGHNGYRALVELAEKHGLNAAGDDIFANKSSSQIVKGFSEICDLVDEKNSGFTWMVRYDVGERFWRAIGKSDKDPAFIPGLTNEALAHCVKCINQVDNAIQNINEPRQSNGAANTV